MSASYDRRQDAGKSWPAKGRWNPDALPGWYLEMLQGLAADLTAWKQEHDPGQQLDPRNDPRSRRRRHIEERARASR